jgi:hypothetical protein
MSKSIRLQNQLEPIDHIASKSHTGGAASVKTKHTCFGPPDIQFLLIPGAAKKCTRLFLALSSINSMYWADDLHVEWITG